MMRYLKRRMKNKMDENSEYGRILKSLAEQFLQIMKFNNQLLEENLNLMKERDDLRKQLEKENFVPLNRREEEEIKNG